MQLERSHPPRKTIGEKVKNILYPDVYRCETIRDFLQSKEKLKPYGHKLSLVTEVLGIDYVGLFFYGVVFTRIDPELNFWKMSDDTGNVIAFWSDQNFGFGDNLLGSFEGSSSNEVLENGFVSGDKVDVAMLAFYPKANQLVVKAIETDEVNRRKKRKQIRNARFRNS